MPYNDAMGPFGTGGGSSAPISGGAVTSVFGRSGDVVSANGDYGTTKITNQSSVAGATATLALNALLATDVGLQTISGNHELRITSNTNSIASLVAISAGFVPYTGATGNVNLGTYSLIADSVKFNTTPSITAVQGEMYWDATEGTAAILLDATSGVTLSIGTEQYLKCVNKTGVQINDGAVVTISGAQGNRPKVVLANATDVNSSMIIGVATQNIADNAEGFITTHGDVHGYNTSGFTAGDTLYLSTTPGQLVNTPASSPNNVVIVATATNSTINGTITVHTSRPLAGNTALGSSNLISPTQLAVKTYADTKKTDSMATNKLLGRSTAGTGVIEEITLGTGLEYTGTTLNVTVSGGTGGGHTIQDEGSPLTQRANLNFVGTGVTVTDDADNDATVVSISISGGSGASTFLELTDTPSSYSGEAGKGVRVNSGATGLEFYAISGGSSTAPSPIRLTVGGDNGAAIVANAVPIIYYHCPTAATMVSWTALGDISGSISVDVWATTYANFPPLSGDKISDASPITISGGTKQQGTMASWTTQSISADSVLAFKVTQAATITMASFDLKLS